MVSATERKAGGRVISAAATTSAASGRLLVVDLRPGAVAGVACALSAFAAEMEEVDGPAMGEGETVRVWAACGSFAGTLSTSDVVCGCGGEVAVVEVEVWGGE